ncbi:hypothetical protein [Telluribacter sp. SYSU D00476]|uniref:hypothetical protein n=1 Tax=Telluribacter sp. SYSU D00476 TaxID=2811430 RepID=UPI001FF53430|nr:hypothetical protein [Telluribacter sp. SYSU D00476]
MTRNTLYAYSLLLLIFISGCAPMRYPYPPDDTDRDRDREVRNYRLSELGIPKGHLPPPGECKVWFPGRPPGQQPPPQSCGSALRDAPLGAWVIVHEGQRYKVNIYNRTRRNLIDEVRYYE